MKLLLTSFGHETLRDFASGSVAYIPDAARTFADHPYAQVERGMLRDAGYTIIELPLSSTPPADVERTLASADAVYVAGGETFDLLHVLRSTGADEVLVRHVPAGLPYIGCSAGAVVAGPHIGPVSLLDSSALAPGLKDYRGLGLTDYVVIPHVGTDNPQFPIDVFAETVRNYGSDHRLVLLRDGEALLIDDTGTRLI
ncbi:Type 1 glutamine amidotransferase-like domain-containing protein [Corynebacterium comes]|uniref:Peptidase n=1 Tax=Corynebacterium comes TaxID=2675218 RepID=A0A6B8VQS0_9CORY|nr:Type 1 glutamine amidotransferase-like domain-containing protein [Corynebacterium comes]QGU03694.1 putative peptidase [Corynebacterium comes]